MNLPQTNTSTGALLTGNATVENTGTGPNSTNTASSSQTNNLNLTNSPSGTITNNVDAGAISGNANVNGNTVAGNATSGNASVATNIANIFGSQLSLTHWFGVLVINVFGNWTGDVNKDTAAGESAATGSGGAGNSAATAGGGSAPATFAQLGSSSGSGSGGGIVGNLSSVAAHLNAASPALGGNALVAAVHSPQTAAKAAARSTGILLVLAAITLLLAGVFFGLERKLKQV